MPYGTWRLGALVVKSFRSYECLRSRDANPARLHAKPRDLPDFKEGPGSLAKNTADGKPLSRGTGQFWNDATFRANLRCVFVRATQRVERGAGRAKPSVGFPEGFRLMDQSITIAEPPSDFGIRLMDDEQLIASLRPYRFVRYAVVAAAITIVGVVFLPFVLIWAVLAVRRYHYWLTNKRVIWCHGFIGYKVRSVPLERITDVVISRTLPELLAGMSSIEVRDMTGQFQTPSGFGAKWIGVENAPEIQKLILEQIRAVNEAAKRV
jgi:hypothetical protein